MAFRDSNSNEVKRWPWMEKERKGRFGVQLSLSAGAREGGATHEIGAWAKEDVRHIKQVLELENGVQQEKSMVLCGTTSLSNGFSLVVTLLKDIVYLYINLSFFFFTDHYLQHVESKKCSDQLKMNIKSLWTFFPSSRFERFSIILIHISMEKKSCARAPVGEVAGGLNNAMCSILFNRIKLILGRSDIHRQACTHTPTLA